MILRMLGFFKCFAFSCEWSRVESFECIDSKIRPLYAHHAWIDEIILWNWSLQDLGLCPDVDWICMDVELKLLEY